MAVGAKFFVPVEVGALTGATHSAFWGPATTSGSPASGTWAQGSVVATLAGEMFVCTVAGTPGTWVQVGGGSGSVSAVTGAYGGDPVTIANNAQAPLTWDTLSAGTELLDRSDPEFPLVLADGIYVVSGQIVPDALTAGGYATLGVTLSQLAGFAVEADQSFPAALIGALGDTATTVPHALVAGDLVTATVYNGDGSVSRDFSLFAAYLTKLT